MRSLQMILGLLAAGWLSSCAQINLFEKQVAIPDQQWQRSFRPSYSFEIEDTAALYNMYIVVRHTDNYEYNNLWLRVGSMPPGDTITYENLIVELATPTRWLGTGISDIFEVRKLISPGPAAFRKPGIYTFTLEQIMRENPLEHIMNVGIRIEKVE